MNRKPLIYVCGAYRVPSPTTNTAAAIRVGFIVRDDIGAVPCIPHLSLIEDLHTSRTDQYWLDATMDQMRCCDAVFRFNKSFSSGADAEEREAVRLGIPVFHEFATLADWVKQWKEQHDAK